MPTENSSAPHRAIAVGATLAAAATLVPVSLYQNGVIARLPDPPYPLFDSQTITSAPTAYPLGIPDSYLGLASYTVTLALLLSCKNSALARRLLRAKLVADGGLAAVNFGRQIVSFRKLCSWCCGTALATAMLVPAATTYLNHLEKR